MSKSVIIEGNFVVWRRFAVLHAKYSCKISLKIFQCLKKKF